MADNEKNLPVQDPENQENEIKDLSSTPESVASDEVNAAVEESGQVAEVAKETEPSGDAPEVDSEPQITAEEAEAEYAAQEADTVEKTEEEVINEEATAEEVVGAGEFDDFDDLDDEDEDESLGDEDAESDSTAGSGNSKYYNPEVDEDYDVDEEIIDPEDLVIYDEVLKAIKAEGERLVNTEESLKAYYKHSSDAIKNFETALKIGQKALESNRDDKEAPAILAGIIKICGQILEVKCNNLENYVRVKAYTYIKEARTKLHHEIERYNDKLISYSSLTGEQLTRLSSILPESIVSGKSLAVVPVLTYRESYVQIASETNLTADEEAILTVVNPVYSAEMLMSGCSLPKTKGGCAAFGRRVKSATKKLNSECERLSKQIHRINTLRKRYENEVSSFESKTPLADRRSAKYKSKILEISNKYGKQIAGISTIKAESAFARTRVRLMINRLAIEREKLVLAYSYMHEAYRLGGHKQRRDAQNYLSKAIASYNSCAELCSKVCGTKFDTTSADIIEKICRDKAAEFPKIAYKRELVETVGNNSRTISMVVMNDVAPNEQAYAEASERILGKKDSIRGSSVFSDEAVMEDRASAIAKVMIESLKDSADMVLTTDELEFFNARSEKAIKYFKKTLKSTEKAMAKAFDEHGVITALVENLRVIANLIEVRRICISVAMKLGQEDLARANSRELYRNIELYNGRAIDYMSIVGEQFSRISIATAKDLMNTADELNVPMLTYRDNYIEVFPKDPLKDSTFEKPRQWRAGIYTPLLMKHFRLTENRAVETTVINSPFVFDVMTDEMPAVSWWHPIGFLEHLFVFLQPVVAWWHRVCTNIEIWFVDESLLFSQSGIHTRQKRNDRKKSKYERKLKKLTAQYEKVVLDLETVVHETDRHTAEYQKKLYAINEKFSRKIYRLKVRWMKDCPSINETKLMLERLVLERERLAGINKVLLKYRSYGRITFTKNVLVRYKKKFIEAITAHNQTARKLSDMVGVKFSEVSTSVAEEIIRYGNMIKFPEIVCCREIIETVNGKERTVGDRWHGYGLYTGTSGSAAANSNAPIMSVGAMGYATSMGVPFLKADMDGMTMIGITPGGVPLIGFSSTGETTIPFTGTPMMLTGSDTSVVLDAGLMGHEAMVLGAADVTDPYSGIHKRGVDARYTDEIENDAKDLTSGCEVETPLDGATKMIEERFTRALRARAMTTVDDTANWWKLVGSEWNVRFMRYLMITNNRFLESLLPQMDDFYELVNRKIDNRFEAELLAKIAKVAGIIDIECKRLYSAVKTGVRRSQRVWSSWLHDDIDYYNTLVKAYNSGRPRHDHIELLSYNIPDTIIFRKEDRPPAPPILSLRNRVKLVEDAKPVKTDEIYDELARYAMNAADRMKLYTRHIRSDAPALLIILYYIFSGVWKEIANLRLELKCKKLRKIYEFEKTGKAKRIEKLEQKGKHKKAAKLREKMIRRSRERAMPLIHSILAKRFSKTYFRRQQNETRHYYIRDEKARAMRKYNKATLRAIGIANDPIKYQNKLHKVLRKYLVQNFRIDYNMRKRQLAYRSLIGVKMYGHQWYLCVAAAIAVAILLGTIFLPEHNPTMLYIIGFVWVGMPVFLDCVRMTYDLIMMIVNVFTLITRNIYLLRWGSRDVERNLYGSLLDCFVSEQHRLLMACEALHRNKKSTSAKKKLIATVNDYNKRVEIYSEKLRIHIKPIEITTLIEKLVCGYNHELEELQNFVYVRELVERVDRHERGKTLTERELGELVGEINSIINTLNIAAPTDQVAVDALHDAMKKLIGYVQSGIKPTQTERYQLKVDLISCIESFEAIIGKDKVETFARNVIKIVDQIGGRDSRKIIGVLATDDMIIFDKESLIPETPTKEQRKLFKKKWF